MKKEKKIAKIARIIGMILCVIGFLWFMMPLIRLEFELGVVVGGAICALGFLILWQYPQWVKKGRKWKVFARVAGACYTAGILWCVFLTFLMFSYQTDEIPSNTTVMVLGSQVHSVERMGISLTNRVNAALGYLEKNPESACIVTGGQGGNEPCTEAQAQQHALLKAGISADRIYLENKSRNTRQNMDFSIEIAKEAGLSTQVIVVTQSFHMYRALQLAKNAGWEAYPLVAETDPVMFPSYYGRELLSLTKWMIERLILE